MSGVRDDEIDCPQCGSSDLESDPKWTIRTCKGCGRIFLEACEPNEWEVVGYLESR